MRRQAAGWLPNSIDGGQLRSVRRQKEQGEEGAVFAKQWFEPDRVMIPGIVQHQDDTRVAGAMLPQRLQKSLERHGMEHLAHGTNELAAAQTDRAKAVDRLRVGAWSRTGSLISGGTEYMLLEVAYVPAPEFNSSAAFQTIQFFKVRDLNEIGLGDLRPGLA